MLYNLKRQLLSAMEWICKKERSYRCGRCNQQFAYRETEHVSTFTIFARTDSGTDGYPFEQYAGSECYGSGAWCDNNV